jgi:2-hydroxychromene-2-carboxylate isomerase
MTPIEFWFDFASGYAYFAALDIEALAARHGRAVVWRPFTLGAAFKVTGAQGLSRTPLNEIIGPSRSSHATNPAG